MCDSAVKKARLRLDLRYAFQACAIGHSATSPQAISRLFAETGDLCKWPDSPRSRRIHTQIHTQYRGGGTWL